MIEIISCMIFLGVMLVGQYGMPSMFGSSRPSYTKDSKVVDKPLVKPVPSSNVILELDRFSLDQIKDLYSSIEEIGLDSTGEKIKKYLEFKEEEFEKEQKQKTELAERIDKIGFDPEKLTVGQLETLVIALEK
ncbi:hypothetical protein HOK51_11075 [Candidatus Woesearchaeota archaeon]|jgi:hypothetical protein|nr:hypothetical protein [Candidatus Woesearchaeota archaeon]MBT6520364.1 hypothetical protein [Candidatus Woesearchaeota archaeon]MBT7368554.1 hypothetical protein [Candidatus Woesearchaeota archaeon]